MAVSEASSIPFERKNKTQVVDANVFRVKSVKAGGVNANGSSPRLRVNENRYFPDPRFAPANRVPLGSAVIDDNPDNSEPFGSAPQMA
jgi:hypothetical protein